MARSARSVTSPAILPAHDESAADSTFLTLLAAGGLSAQTATLTPLEKEFQDAMTPRTKLVIINSPGNPTGAVYTREELQAIVEVCADEEILILSDEIYEKLTYDGAEHVSVASLPGAYDLTITINGFS